MRMKHSLHSSAYFLPALLQHLNNSLRQRRQLLPQQNYQSYLINQQVQTMAAVIRACVAVRPQNHVSQKKTMFL